MRMHRIFATRFSGDAGYVISASEDTNIRVWKSQAARPIGVLHPRAKKSLEYKDQLKKRYKDLPEIKRIAGYRHLPRSIKVARDQQLEHRKSQNRKEQNRIKQAKGKIASKRVAEKVVVAEED